jgi:hypothetical protein
MIRKVSEDAFLNHPLPPQTETYVPISNELLIRLIRQEAAQRELVITGKGYRANRANTEFVAMMTMGNEEQGISKMIGVRNSTNKKYAVGFVAGAIVLVCGNGMISGDIVTFRRHTGSVEEDLKEMVAEVFDQLLPNFEKLSEDTKLLKSTELTRNDALDLIADLYFNEKLLNTTQMSVIRESIYLDKNFAFPEDPTLPIPAWNVYNQITSALKHSAPGEIFKSQIKFHELFKQKTGIIIPESSV